MVLIQYGDFEPAPISLTLAKRLSSDDCTAVRFHIVLASAAHPYLNDKILPQFLSLQVKRATP